MEDLQVEDFNDPIEHKDEQTADGIKTPENQENDEEQTSIFKEIMSWVIPFAIALVAALLIKKLSDHQCGCAYRVNGEYNPAGRPFYRKPACICGWRAREGILLYSGIRMMRVRFM